MIDLEKELVAARKRDTMDRGVDRRRWMIVLALLVPPMILGCGAGGPRTVPVTGSVTFNNEWLKTGTLTLKSVGSSTSKHPDPVGSIAEGKYELITGTQPGVPVGRYKVAVQASVPSNPADEYSLPKSIIPEKYARFETTDLELEVVPEPAPGAYDLKLVY